jgi:replicative DNA helicase
MELSPLEPIYSMDAEQAIIGGLLINPDDIDLLGLLPEHFYVQRNRWVYEAISYLSDHSSPIDIITVSDRLDQMGVLSDAGGPAYLTAQISYTPSSMHLESYAEIIKSYHWRRNVLKAANDLAKLAYQFDLDRQTFGEMVNQASEHLAETSNGDGTVHISKVFQEVFEMVSEAYEHPQDIWGMETGLSDLDNFLGGLQPGELIDLAGKPGAGKSKLALEICLGLASSHNNKPGNPGAIYSLEMTSHALGYRAVSSLSEVSTRTLKTGKMTPADWGAYMIGNERGEKLPIWLSDREQTPQTLRADITRLKRVHGIKWFLLDYMMLMGGYRNLKDDTERSKYFSRDMKLIVKHLGVAGIIINSVTKLGMDDKEPDLNDMAGSGAVLHDADIVAFVVSDPKEPNILKVKFKKLRDISGGVDKTLMLYAHTGFPKISNADGRIQNVRL